MKYSLWMVSLVVLQSLKLVAQKAINYRLMTPLLLKELIADHLLGMVKELD